MPTCPAPPGWLQPPRLSALGPPSFGRAPSHPPAVTSGRRCGELTRYIRHVSCSPHAGLHVPLCLSIHQPPRAQGVWAVLPGPPTHPPTLEGERPPCPSPRPPTPRTRVSEEEKRPQHRAVTPGVGGPWRQGLGGGEMYPVGSRHRPGPTPASGMKEERQGSPGPHWWLLLTVTVQDGGLPSWQPPPSALGAPRPPRLATFRPKFALLRGAATRLTLVRGPQ